MDIIVTIPKHLMASVEREEEIIEECRQNGEEVHYFWGVSRKPKYLDIGDKCYFVWDKAIRAWHEVVGFAENMTCSTTWVYHPGICIVLDTEIHEIEPIPMDSFRGYRYKKT